MIVIDQLLFPWHIEPSKGSSTVKRERKKSKVRFQDEELKMTDYYLTLLKNASFTFFMKIMITKREFLFSIKPYQE